MTTRSTRPIVLLVALAIAAVGFVAGRACAPAAPTGVAAQLTGPSAPTVWTCAMHPQVRLPAPGQCPICFMDLIPATSGDEDDDEPRVLTLSASAASLAEIETAPVQRKLVAHEIRMVGKVAFDETRVAYLTAWVPGRLDRLFVDYTGVTVRAGDHMVEIYSPRLYAAQQELLQTVEATRRMESSPLEVLRESGERTVHAAREKLRLLGLTETQVRELEERGEPSERVTLYAPSGGVVVDKQALEGLYVDEGTRIYTIVDLSKIWVLLDAYESDLAWLRFGQDVELSVAAFPGEAFHGRIAFIDPVLDDRTRTVKVRLNVENADQRLKPGMFVSASAAAVLTPAGRPVDAELAGKWMCPMHPEVLADSREACTECGMDLVPATELGFVATSEAESPLVVPATAPLVTGERAVVYVRLPGATPRFEGREVVLGPRAGDWYIVAAGLTEGERVVVKGAFKLDSELQIRARPSMMSAERDPGHGHAAAAESRATLPATDALRAGLGDLVDRYLVLQRALAADDDDAARAAARKLPPALGQVEHTDLEHASHERWSEVADTLEDAIADVVAADDIAARRAVLEPLTRALVAALDTFGHAHEEELGLFHCPMALDGVGADWIQTGATTANPYYGASMLRCGSRTRVLDREP